MTPIFDRQELLALTVHSHQTVWRAVVMLLALLARALHSHREETWVEENRRKVCAACLENMRLKYDLDNTAKKRSHECCAWAREIRGDKILYRQLLKVQAEVPRRNTSNHANEGQKNANCRPITNARRAADATRAAKKLPSRNYHPHWLVVQVRFQLYS